VFTHCTRTNDPRCYETPLDGTLGGKRNILRVLRTRNVPCGHCEYHWKQLPVKTAVRIITPYSHRIITRSNANDCKIFLFSFLSIFSYLDRNTPDRRCTCLFLNVFIIPYARPNAMVGKRVRAHDVRQFYEFTRRARTQVKVSLAWRSRFAIHFLPFRISRFSIFVFDAIAKPVTMSLFNVACNCPSSKSSRWNNRTCCLRRALRFSTNYNTRVTLDGHFDRMFVSCTTRE
jgi:hypothetical protein